MVEGFGSTSGAPHGRKGNDRNDSGHTASVLL